MIERSDGKECAKKEYKDDYHLPTQERNLVGQRAMSGVPVHHLFCSFTTRCAALRPVRGCKRRLAVDGRPTDRRSSASILPHEAELRGGVRQQPEEVRREGISDMGELSRVRAVSQALRVCA